MPLHRSVPPHLQREGVHARFGPVLEADLGDVVIQVEMLALERREEGVQRCIRIEPRECCDRWCGTRRVALRERLQLAEPFLVSRTSRMRAMMASAVDRPGPTAAARNRRSSRETRGGLGAFVRCSGAARGLRRP